MLRHTDSTVTGAESLCVYICHIKESGVEGGKCVDDFVQILQANYFYHLSLCMEATPLISLGMDP